MNTVNNFKACLFCGQSIRSAATLCRFCKKPQTGNGTVPATIPQADDTMKPCCACGQQIKKQALLCRYCRQKQTETPATPQPNIPQSPANNTDMKACPHCGQSIKAIAIKCRYCKQNVPNIPPHLSETNNKPETEADNSQPNQIAPPAPIAETTTEPPATDGISTPIADRSVIGTQPVGNSTTPVLAQTLATAQTPEEISVRPTGISDMKTCPHCGEKIKAIAIKCRYCKHNLDSEANVSTQVSQDTNNDTASMPVSEKSVSVESLVDTQKTDVSPVLNTAPDEPTSISTSLVPQIAEPLSIVPSATNGEPTTPAIEAIEKPQQKMAGISQTTIEEPITTDTIEPAGTQEASDQKACPFCGESIKAVAILCRYCKQSLVEAPAPSQPEPPQTPAVEIPAPVSQLENNITADETAIVQNQATETKTTAIVADIPAPVQAEIPSIQEPAEQTVGVSPVTDEVAESPEQTTVADVALMATTVEITASPPEDTTKQKIVEQTTAEAPVIMQEDTDLKNCPFCGEQIKAIAVLCRYCKQHLPDTQNDAPAVQTNSPSSTESVVPPPALATEKNTQDPLATSDIKIPDNNVPSEAEQPKATEPQKKKPSTIIYIVIGLVIAALLGGGAFFLMNRNKQEAPAPQASPNNITPEPTSSSTPPEALPPKDKSEGATGGKVPAPKPIPQPRSTPKPKPASKPTQGTKIKGDIDW